MDTIIIENVRGQWVVDKDTEDAFLEKKAGYADGALLKLRVSEVESLCHHPNEAAICSHCGK